MAAGCGDAGTAAGQAWYDAGSHGDQPIGRETHMLLILAIVMITVTGGAYWFVGGSRRQSKDDLSDRTFRTPELRELDAHLDQIALEELRRLDKQLAHYVASEVGHVLLISRSPHGIALELSDGRRLALGGVSQSAHHLLITRAAKDELRPAHVHRDAFSYRLLFRGRAGTETEVHARYIALDAG
jgi:hypothetical protein